MKDEEEERERVLILELETDEGRWKLMLGNWKM